MPRKLTLKTAECLDLSIFAVYSYGGVWEEGWRSLQSEEIADLLPIIPQEDWDHALNGWTKPFVKLLGLPPEGALRKIPQVCSKAKKCIYKSPACKPTNKGFPWCFSIGLNTEEKEHFASILLGMWREGTRVVVVEHKEL